MGEPGISERALVGRRVAFDDGEVLAKYTLPFVNLAWHVPFTVLDRMGGPPRVDGGTIQWRGDRLHASGKMAALRSVESIRIDHFAEMRPQALVRPLLVRPHQPRVTRHIGGKDRGETAFDGLLHGLPQGRRS